MKIFRIDRDLDMTLKEQKSLIYKCFNNVILVQSDGKIITIFADSRKEDVQMKKEIPYEFTDENGKNLVSYRAKKKRGGEWIFSNFFVPGPCGSIYMPDSDSKANNPAQFVIDPEDHLVQIIADMVEIDPNTLTLYVGVLDVNRNRIFNGDIIKISYIGKAKGIEGGYAEVIFYHGQYGVRWGYHQDFVPLNGFCNCKFEVVGNVVDNSDILERNQWE